MSWWDWHLDWRRETMDIINVSWQTLQTQLVKINRFNEETKGLRIHWCKNDLPWGTPAAHLTAGLGWQLRERRPEREAGLFSSWPEALFSKPRTPVREAGRTLDLWIWREGQGNRDRTVDHLLMIMIRKIAPTCTVCWCLRLHKPIKVHVLRMCPEFSKWWLITQICLIIA